jgi:hypothetical protein
MRKTLILSFSFCAAGFVFSDVAYGLGGCTDSQPRAWFTPSPGSDSDPHLKGQVAWTYEGPEECKDAYHVRIGLAGRSADQKEVEGKQCGANPATAKSYPPCAYDVDLIRDKPYVFQVQACDKKAFEHDVCSQWGTAYYVRYGVETCKDGFVWRELVANDKVCVDPHVREDGLKDNAAAAQRRAPQGGPSGPDTCQQGFVWRELTPADHVCVSVEAREQGKKDNAAAMSRRAMSP